LKGQSYNKIKEKYKIMSKDELEKKIKEFIKSGVEDRYLIQEAIKRFKFNADIKDIIEIINKTKNQHDN